MRRSQGKAAHWYREAAEHGAPEAFSELGERYLNGEGVRQDPRLAHMFHDLAARAWSNRDVVAAEAALDRRDRVALELDPESLAEALQLAEEWIESRAW